MSIFSKLFKKNTNTNFNLINLNDIIIFPKKEFYKENKEKYKEYMDTYNQILSSKKYITSLDLKINNIDINFYTNIITKTEPAPSWLEYAIVENEHKFINWFDKLNALIKRKKYLKDEW